METGRDGPWLVLKLDRGAEVLLDLVRALREEEMAAGVVTAGIGAFRDFELGWFDPEAHAYERTRYEGSHELLSLQGTVSLGADPPVHLHASLADRGNRVVGGHLFEARVAVLAEIAVRAFPGLVMDRAVNPATGLGELTIRRASKDGTTR